MDQRINRALVACLENFDHGTDQSAFEGLLSSLIAVFESEDTFMNKVSNLDELIDEHPAYDEIREVLFDLLLMNFLAADAAKLEEDYLESEEWLEIEDQTIDRGTELLNLLLYLAECADEGIEADLEDFLKEFLLVDDDEFQDEYRIYEPVIARQILTESSYEEIGKAALNLQADQELYTLFYPLLSFFYEPQPAPSDLEDYMQFSPHPTVDKAIYQLIVQYYQ